MTRDKTWQKVRAACRWLAENKRVITVKAVAEKAGIGRATIYRDSELLNYVEKYEISYHFQKGRDEARTGYEAGYKDGYAAGLAAARSARLRPAGSQEWACGILHIPAGARLTAELVKKKFRQLSHLLHPDKGGRDDLQRDVIDAYNLLKRLVGE